MNIFSKISSNEYNNRLEQILEEKTFDETVKNLLLSMLYKIESGYKDYKIAKINAYSKEEFMEKILYIVKEDCKQIKIVTPKTEASKPLEEIDDVCKIDAKKGEILVYANENDLLYSLEKIYEERRRNIEENSGQTYYGKAIKEFMIEARCINNCEVIRDFDGWSWNSGLNTEREIIKNLIFQNILLSNIQIKESEYLNALINPYYFDRTIYTVIITLVAKQNEELRKEIYKQRDIKKEALDKMANRTQFLNEITEEKKKITNQIKEIDEIINDKAKLQKEYYSRNEKLENKDKIFSTKYLVKILEQERTQKLEELKLKNKILEPKEFIKQKSLLENEYTLLNKVITNVEDEKLEKESIINVQKEFLEIFADEVEKGNDKTILEENIYKLRYYCLIPFSQQTYIKDIKELQEPLKKVMNIIIDNSIDKEIITNFSDSVSLCYAILKNLFYTKIIELQEVAMKITNTKKEKTDNGLEYHITINIYDEKDAQEKDCEVVNNLNKLNVKLDKKIPVFIKGKR